MGGPRERAGGGPPGGRADSQLGVCPGGNPKSQLRILVSHFFVVGGDGEPESAAWVGGRGGEGDRGRGRGESFSGVTFRWEGKALGGGGERPGWAPGLLAGGEGGAGCRESFSPGGEGAAPAGAGSPVQALFQGKRQSRCPGASGGTRTPEALPCPATGTALWRRFALGSSDSWDPCKQEGGPGVESGVPADGGGGPGSRGAGRSLVSH